MGTFFSFLLVGGIVAVLAVLFVVMPLDFGEAPWNISGKSGNK